MNIQNLRYLLEIAQRGSVTAAAKVLYLSQPRPVSYTHLYGRAFVAFYEDYARKNGCICLRIDTNEKNENARRLYAKLGYREAGIVPCVFNGIPGVNLVCLEKKL